MEHPRRPRLGLPPAAADLAGSAAQSRLAGRGQTAPPRLCAAPAWAGVPIARPQRQRSLPKDETEGLVRAWRACAPSDVERGRAEGIRRSLLLQGAAQKAPFRRGDRRGGVRAGRTGQPSPRPPARASVPRGYGKAREPWRLRRSPPVCAQSSRVPQHRRSA